MDLGLKLKKKRHRALEFNQSPRLKLYTDFNTQKRTQAIKLMNNSVFGETKENIRKRVDERLVTDKNKLSNMTSKPT